MTAVESNSVEVDGKTVAYRQAGQGPALVLLHGSLTHSDAGDTSCRIYRISSG